MILNSLLHGNLTRDMHIFCATELIPERMGNPYSEALGTWVKKQGAMILCIARLYHSDKDP